MTGDKGNAVLSSYRVLDLTDDRGQLAGAILAGLGAEVILVEPPGGSRSRRSGPWAGDRRDVEASLSHWAYNRGKRSVVLDLEGSGRDRDVLRSLAVGADVLFESAPPGQLDKLGLGYDDLREANPALVYVSITPFGRDGPKAHWAATELTVWASTMTLSITGDADRPPVRVSLPQAFLHAGGDAATGALIALLERARSGLGQHVDVSAQQASLQAALAQVLAAPWRASPARRMAGGVRVAHLDVQLLWPCKDGFVTITLLFGAAIAHMTQRLMDWVYEEGHCDETLRDKNWVDYTVLLFTGQEPVDEYERVKKAVESFTLTRTKAELMAGALQRQLLIAPVSTPEDLVLSEHFAARDYWDDVDDAEISPRPIRCPGPFAKPSAMPLLRLGRAARLGEHTDVVLAEPPRNPAHVPAKDPSNDLPLEGLKVLDFTWVLAGPTMGRVLADYGATVIRVESVTRIDGLRTLTPFLNDEIDPEKSGSFCSTNAGKLSVALNLARPEAREVALDLVRWADVVLESFSPRAMRGFGLDYEHLRDVNPGMVMLSSCLMGQTGPLGNFGGTGNMAAAVMGFYGLTGWPDRWPSGPFGAYTDAVAPRFALAALLAALDLRRRTGESQYIDFSQAEGGVYFLSPAILDYTVNGHVMQRRGNADPQMAPHGVYRSIGEDDWVAIACETDAHWSALCSVLGRADLADDPDLNKVERRLARAEEIDKIVEEWTEGLTPEEAMARCQAAGVPAHAVLTSPSCLADPQLRHLGHFVEVEHDIVGTATIEGSRMLLSRTPARVGRPAPLIGQHTHQVLSEVLGYSEERIGDLYAAEVLE